MLSRKKRVLQAYEKLPEDLRVFPYEDYVKVVCRNQDNNYSEGFAIKMLESYVAKHAVNEIDILI